MASENETFDEVLRCMQNDIVHFVGKPVKHSRDLLQEYHDRFKAAHRREVDVVLKDRDEMFKSEQDTVAKTKEWFDEYQKLKLEVAELKSKMNDVVCENEALRDACGTCGAKRERESTREKSSRVGNAAKMREVCANIAEYAKAASCHTDDSHLLGYLYQIERWAESALAAPPRNCDRPECATSKTAQDVWSSEDGGKTAYYEWLLQKYEEGGTK